MDFCGCRESLVTVLKKSPLTPEKFNKFFPIYLCKSSVTLSESSHEIFATNAMTANPD